MQKLVRNRLPVAIRLKQIVDLDEAKRDEVQERFGYEETGDDWRAMLPGDSCRNDTGPRRQAAGGRSLSSENGYCARQLSWLSLLQTSRPV